MARLLTTVLPCLSFDVLGLVDQYLHFAVATAHAMPRALHAFGGQDSLQAETQFDYACFAVACSPDQRIWVGDARLCRVFDAQAAWMHGYAAPEMCQEMNMDRPKCASG